MHVDRRLVVLPRHRAGDARHFDTVQDLGVEILFVLVPEPELDVAKADTADGGARDLLGERKLGQFLEGVIAHAQHHQVTGGGLGVARSRFGCTLHGRCRRGSRGVGKGQLSNCRVDHHGGGHG
ncbi:hypothetical protein D3C86_1759420 [compost metagenome]